MLAVVLIDAGSVWGALRNFFFGIFGFNAFIVPLFNGFISIMSAIGKDDRKNKIKVFEGVVVFSLIVAFIHIVKVDSQLTYGEQIEEAYNVFKSYGGEGMRYGLGVFGALVGGIPLLLTASNKLAAGLFTVLILLALVMFFSGTTILKLMQSLKKPAEAVGEYAEEKLDDIKQTYHNVAEDINDMRARKAESAEKRRKVTKHEIELDIPLDDEVFEDVGIEPILGETDIDDLPPVELDDVIALFQEPDNGVDNIKSLEELRNIAKSQPEEYLEEVTEVVSEASSYEVDTQTGEIIEKTEEQESAVELAEPVVQYELPAVELLDEPKRTSKAGSGNELREKGETIVKTLQSFGVGTRIVEICQSPSVTRFELQPEPGVKISKITALADDIEMNLAACGVRIDAPIPNKNAVGIEVPNAEKAMVTLREILETDSFRNSKSKINVALGRDIQGESTCADLAKMPHLLVAGTTGSGKSVCLNTMIMSLLYNAKPDEVKLIMIDPK